MMLGVALLIIVGAVCDYFDGYVARRLGATSPSGEILDSFADLVTFCIAPALMMAKLAQESAWPFVAFFVCVIPILCGVIRLTKFMVNKKNPLASQNYMGLPTTIFGLCAALTLAALAVQEMTYLPVEVFGGFVGTAILMIIWRCKYPKNITAVRITLWLIAAVLIIVTAIWWPTMVFVTVFTAMLLLGLFYGSIYLRS
jgi:phosphatidylserine synthase